MSRTDPRANLTRRQAEGRAQFADREQIRARGNDPATVFDRYTSGGAIVRQGGREIPASIGTNGLLKPGQVVPVTVDGGGPVVHGMPKMRQVAAAAARPDKYRKIQIVFSDFGEADQWKVAGYKPKPQLTKILPGGSFPGESQIGNLTGFHNLGKGTWALTCFRGDPTARTLEVAAVYSEGRVISETISLPIGINQIGTGAFVPGTVSPGATWPGGVVMTTLLQTGFPSISNGFTDTFEYRQYGFSDGSIETANQSSVRAFAQRVDSGEVIIGPGIRRSYSLIYDRVGVQENFEQNGTLVVPVACDGVSAVYESQVFIGVLGGAGATRLDYKIATIGGDESIPTIHPSYRDFPCQLVDDLLYQIRQRTPSPASHNGWLDFYDDSVLLVRVFGLRAGTYSDFEEPFYKIPFYEFPSGLTSAQFDQSYGRYHPR